MIWDASPPQIKALAALRDVLSKHDFTIAADGDYISVEQWEPYACEPTTTVVFYQTLTAEDIDTILHRGIV
jgi:hypothetical protein